MVVGVRKEKVEQQSVGAGNSVVERSALILANPPHLQSTQSGYTPVSFPTPHTYLARAFLLSLLGGPWCRQGFFAGIFADFDFFADCFADCFADFFVSLGPL